MLFLQNPVRYLQTFSAAVGRAPQQAAALARAIHCFRGDVPVFYRYLFTFHLSASRWVSGLDIPGREPGVFNPSGAARGNVHAARLERLKVHHRRFVALVRAGASAAILDAVSATLEDPPAVRRALGTLIRAASEYSGVSLKDSDLQQLRSPEDTDARAEVAMRLASRLSIMADDTPVVDLRHYSQPRGWAAKRKSARPYNLIVQSDKQELVQLGLELAKTACQCVAGNERFWLGAGAASGALRKLMDLALDCVQFHSRKSLNSPAITDDMAKCAVKAHSISLRDGKSNRLALRFLIALLTCRNSPTSIKEYFIPAILDHAAQIPTSIRLCVEALQQVQATGTALPNNAQVLVDVVTARGSGSLAEQALANAPPELRAAVQLIIDQAGGNKEKQKNKNQEEKADQNKGGSNTAESAGAKNDAKN